MGLIAATGALLAATAALQCTHALLTDPAIATLVESDNSGAAVGQSQQFMQAFDTRRGAAIAKSLSGLTRQSK